MLDMKVAHDYKAARLSTKSQISVPQYIYYTNFPSAPVHLLHKLYYTSPQQRVTFDPCVRAAACAAGAFSAAFFFSLFSAFTGVSAAVVAGGVGGACAEGCSAAMGLP